MVLQAGHGNHNRNKVKKFQQTAKTGWKTIHIFDNLVFMRR